MNKNIKHCKNCGRIVGNKKHICPEKAWNKGINISDETKKKIGNANRGKIAWNKGRKLSKEEKDKQDLFGLTKGRGWNIGIKGEESHMHGKQHTLGYKHTEEAKKKISKNGFHYGMLGKKMTKESKLKMSIAHRGEKSNFWKGGITKLSSKVRGSYKYRQWVSDIFARDDFACNDCKVRGGQLHAHHIEQFAIIMKKNKIKTLEEALNCSELWNLNNGITLCLECHKKTESYLKSKVENI